MNKRLAIMSLILTGMAYGADIQLEKSVISATGFETAQKDTVKNVTVVTSKEIEEKNYQSVTEVLNDIPSVNIIGDPNNPVIDMRGQGNTATTNVQVLIDGVGVNLLESSHVNTPINTVPVENIERIEVIPGGGSILYGGGTRGGIINIITKAGAGYNGGSIGGEFTSFGGKKGDVSYGTTLGNTGVNISYTKNDYKGYRDEDELDSEYFEGTVKHQISDTQRLTFKYARYEEDAITPNTLTKEQVNADREQSGYVGGESSDSRTTKKNDFNLKYDQKISENIDFTLTTFYQKADVDLISSNGASIMRIEDEKYGFKPKLRIGYRENDELILGYDYINSELNRDSDARLDFSKMPPNGYMQNEKYLSEFTKETHSVFALNKNRVGKFEFSQGFRYEYADYDISRYQKIVKTGDKVNETSVTEVENSKYENNYAWELMGNYLYSDTGNIYAKVERGFTSPSPNQLTNKKDNSYYSVDLDSETYITYELGAKDYILGSFVSGAIYLTDTDDEIATETVGTKTITNSNIGKTRRYGAELSAEQYFGNLTVREGYSFVKTEIKEDSNKSLEGNEIANVPTHKLSFGLDYRFNEKLSLTSTTTYSSKYYLNNENNGGKQNSHTVTDVTINYYPITTLRLYAGINNIFNEKYYNSVSISSKNVYSYDPAAERSFTLGFKYNF